jgi:hypothetical protein
MAHSSATDYTDICCVFLFGFYAFPSSPSLQIKSIRFLFLYYNEAMTFQYLGRILMLSIRVYNPSHRIIGFIKFPTYILGWYPGILVSSVGFFPSYTLLGELVLASDSEGPTGRWDPETSAYLQTSCAHFSLWPTVFIVEDDDRACFLLVVGILLQYTKVDFSP